MSVVVVLLFVGGGGVWTHFCAGWAYAKCPYRFPGVILSFLTSLLAMSLVSALFFLYCDVINEHLEGTDLTESIKCGSMFGTLFWVFKVLPAIVSKEMSERGDENEPSRPDVG